MRLIPVLILGLLTSCAGAEPEPEAPDPRRDPLSWPDEVGPDERRAALITPSAYAPDDGFPLIVVLHGYGATGSLQQRFFRLGERVGERGGYAVLAPDGLEDITDRRYWNATDACCNFANVDVDDVGYLLGLIDEVESKVPIDPDRILFVGHSNGGFMSYRMACDASDRIAGIASLAGAMWYDTTECGATEPVSVLQIHGTADTTIKYDGGQIRDLPPLVPSALESVTYWADLAGCEGTTEDGPLDYEAFEAGPDTNRRTWTGCQDGHNVGLWTIEDGEHIPTLTEQFDEDLLDWLMDQRR